MEAWISILIGALVSSLGELDPSDGLYDEIVAAANSVGIDIKQAGEITPEARLKLQRIRLKLQLAKIEKEIDKELAIKGGDYEIIT